MYSYYLTNSNLKELQSKFKPLCVNDSVNFSITTRLNGYTTVFTTVIGDDSNHVVNNLYHIDEISSFALTIDDTDKNLVIPNYCLPHLALAVCLMVRCYQYSPYQ